MHSAMVFMANIKEFRINSRMYEECLKHSYSKNKPEETRAKMQISAKGKVIAYDMSLDINVKVTREKFEANPNLVGINKFRNVNSYRKMKSDYLDNQSKAQIESKKFKITCIHCGKLSDASNHKRWHGDNCKELAGNKQTTVYNDLTAELKFTKVSEVPQFEAIGFKVKSPQCKNKK